MLQKPIQFDGVKVFSATKAMDREVLGEKVTEWRARNGHLEILDIVVTQSSDSEFHCVAITVLYKGLAKQEVIPSRDQRLGLATDPQANRRRA